MSKKDKLRFKEMARAQNGKFPGNEEEIQYVRFFNVLEGRKVYDKAKIKAKLEGTATLKDLSDACSYLYHAALRAIQVANDDTMSEVADTATQIKVLIYKGLYHHVPALYEQAMAFAAETEDFEDMLKLIRLWKVALKYSCSAQNTAEQYEKLAAQEREIWAKNANLFEWEQLYDLLVSVRGAEAVRKQEILATIANHPLYLHDGPCLSLKAEIRRLLIKDRPLENLSPNQSERISNLLAIAELIEQHPQLFEDTLIVDRYLNVVSSVGLLGTIFKDEDSCALALQKLSAFLQFRKEADVLVFERVEEINLILIRNSADFHGGEKAISRILTDLEHYGERVNRLRRINFILAIAEIYLVTERPALAAKLLAPLLNNAPLEDDPRPSILLWIYFLISEYELSHAEIMEGWAKHAQKYVKEYKVTDDAGIALVQFFARLSRKNDPVRKKSEFLRFSKEVMPLLSKPGNEYYLIRFPFDQWCECKMEGRRFLYHKTE